MTIRIYIDEDSMERALVRALRVRGVDVVTAFDENMIERPDDVHLDYATEQGRVLFSGNAGDFYQLHTEYLIAGREHAGIFVIPQQRFSVGEKMRRILRLMASKSAADMQNNIEFLTHWG